MRVSGAGVVCYSVKPDGSQLVLLGREKETIGWRQGSNRWSGFSGKVDTSESVHAGAAREFIEESMAVVPIIPGMNVPVQVSELAEILKNGSSADGSGLFEVSMRCKTELCVHISYLRRVPYIDYSVAFNEAREALLMCDSHFRYYHKIKKSADLLPKMLFPGYHISTSLITLSSEPCDQGVLLNIWDDINKKTCTQSFSLGEGASREVEIVYEAWNSVVSFINTHDKPGILEHPAVTIQRIHTHLVGAYVSKSYLEKSEIKWWSLDELEHASRTSPCEFRRFFLENLPELISAVRSLIGNDRPRVWARGSTLCTGTLNETQSWKKSSTSSSTCSSTGTKTTPFGSPASNPSPSPPTFHS
jgi:hypothetical protein